MHLSNADRNACKTLAGYPGVRVGALASVYLVQHARGQALDSDAAVITMARSATLWLEASEQPPGGARTGTRF